MTTGIHRPYTARKPEFVDKVRIIRDVSNSSLDYELPRETAERLRKAGKLCQIAVYANKWDYAHINNSPYDRKFDEESTR